MKRWKCARRFTLVENSVLNREAESHLTRHSVRFQGNDQDNQPTYVHECFIDAPVVTEALAWSRDMLDELLEPYGVYIMVTDVEGRVVGEAEK